MEVRLVSHTWKPLDTIEKAACNCYDSEPTEDFKIMKSCYKSGHHSVLEFATFVFHVEGVSRALLAQITRHRHCSFAVRSQRYCSSFGKGWPEIPKPNGEKNHQSQTLCNNQEEFLVDLYNNGNSCQKLSEIYHIPQTTINGIIKRYTVLRNLSETKFINRDYFSSIDDKTKAYILGLIYSDGCIAVHKGQPNRYSLMIDQKNDEEVLMTRVLKQLKPNGNLIYYPDRDMVRISIQDNQLCSDLSQYGITPQKATSISFKYILDKVSNNLIKEVIRGIFEGDGHIGLYYNECNIINDAVFQISGTYDTCDLIQKILINELNISKTKIVEIPSISNSTYKLSYGGRNQVKKIINWLYGDSNLVFSHSKKMKIISEICPSVYEEYKKQMTNFIHDEYESVIPSSFFKSIDAVNTYVLCLEKCKETYLNIQECLAKEGIYGERANEDARFILPNSCETQFEISLNLRELIHLANERLCTRSQWEIRNLVQSMVNEVTDIYPELEDMLVPKCEKYPDLFFCPESKSCGKHKTLKEIKNAL